MKRSLLFYCAILTALFGCRVAAPAAADQGQDILALPTANSVYLFVFELPAKEVAGFNVYRAKKAGENDSPDGLDFDPVNSAPVAPVADSKTAIEILRGELPDALTHLDLSPEKSWFENYQANKELLDFISFYHLKICEILGRIYRDEDVVSGAGYFYRVELIDAKGNTLKKLGPVSVDVVPPELPATTGFSAEGLGESARLTWDKQDKPVLGWNIQRSESKDSGFEAVNSGVISSSGKTMYMDSPLENGRKYHYYIETVDPVGNTGPPSQTLEVTPRDTTPPSSPAGLDVELKEAKASLTWEMSLETDLAGYNVYKGEKADGDFEKITGNLLPPDTLDFFDADIKEGISLCYKLTAVDKSGNESAKSSCAWLMKPDISTPAPPLELSAKPQTDGSVLITWKGNESDDVIGYYVYRGTDPGSLEKLSGSIVDENENSYTDTIAHHDTTYYYALAAVDHSYNESDLTEAIMVDTHDKVAPHHPASIFARGEDGKVVVSWPANHDRDLVGYRLYRSDSEDGKYSQIGGELAADATEYADTEGVENGKKYWYYLTAIDDFGNESDPSHKTYTVPQDKVSPDPPQGVEASAEKDKVMVRWESGDAHDLTGHRVWRSEAENGVYEPISGDEPLGHEKAFFEDNGIEKEKTYWYRVTSVDSSDNESARSEPAGPVVVGEDE